MSYSKNRYDPYTYNSTQSETYSYMKITYTNAVLTLILGVLIALLIQANRLIERGNSGINNTTKTSLVSRVSYSTTENQIHAASPHDILNVRLVAVEEHAFAPMYKRNYLGEYGYWPLPVYISGSKISFDGR